MTGPYGAPIGEGSRAVGVMPLSRLSMVQITAVSPGLFREVLSPPAFRELVATMVRARARLHRTVIWNVNSTARGGGVAEMLQSLVAYARGAGIDTRWAVIRGRPELYRITKRIHNQIHGQSGDGGELGEREHNEYERSLLPAARELAILVSPGDIVILHDPQTAGLVHELKHAGARVIWRCHIGIDSPNDQSAEAWEFLMPYLASADVYVFSRASHAWKGLDRGKIAVIPPSIDPFTPKNNAISQARVASILIEAGLLSGYATATPYYVRPTGGIGFVWRQARVFETAPPPLTARLVVQVSRWDRLKDPIGVLQGFARSSAHVAAHLIMAGPEVAAVADDPEGAAVLDETVREWRDLPDHVRGRIHLACLPMEDVEENAAIVNALQRRAAVVVQKSLAEGFGLTVAEAMWKARPVVASNVGGIGDQIEQGKTGLLLQDPMDLVAFGEAVSRLLADQELAAAMGTAAQERVRQNFLNDRHLEQYAELLGRLSGGAG